MHIDTPGHRHAPARGPLPTGGGSRSGSGARRRLGTTVGGPRRVAVLALVAAVLVGAAGCTDPGRAGGSTTSEPVGADTTAADPGASAPTVPPPPGGEAPPLPVSLVLREPAGEPDAAYLASLIDLLVVAPEADPEGYEREMFGGDWIDADGDGCDTRAEVLIEESISLAQVDAFGCGIVAGDWVSIYDGVETADPGELDIDHVVPLAEAWRSGASRWDEATRLAFANHLDDPDALVAVSASSNRSKGDRDPAEWQPPNQAAWCAYVRDWTTVKATWLLSADQAEIDALRDLASAC